MAWEWKRLLPSPEPRLDEPREQIWSIRASDRRTYFRLVPALWLVALAAIGYNDLAEPVPAGFRGWFDAARSASSAFLETGTALAMLAMLLTRPLNMTGGALMTLYQAMANRWVVPVIQKHRKEGRTEGRKEAQSLWLAWNERRIEAERGGRPFDEPHPEVETAAPEQ